MNNYPLLFKKKNVYYFIIYNIIWIALNKLNLLYIVFETWTTVRLNMIDRPVDVRKFVV